MYSPKAHGESLPQCSKKSTLVTFLIQKWPIRGRGHKKHEKCRLDDGFMMLRNSSLLPTNW